MPVAIIQYRAEQAAHDFLHMVAISEAGIGPLHGPESSGKKTIIRQFVSSLPADIPVAIVDGTQSDAMDILDAICLQFGYETASDSPDDSLNELTDFIAQHARRIRQPLLIIENFDKMHSSALQVLCKLAVLKLQGRFAIRMILVSNKPSHDVIHSPPMGALAVRAYGAFQLGPMRPRETTRYLYAKLVVSGCDNPEIALPGAMCDELHKISKGWPGILDKAAMQAIERAENWPIRHEHVYLPPAPITPDRAPEFSVVKESVGPDMQKFYLTLNRKTLQEFELKESKILIGRSALCDLTVNSRFVSKHHALLVRTEDAMHLLDLNSTNGTFINSCRIQSTELRHEDVISLGNHGIKLICPAYRTRTATEEEHLDDTTKMKTLLDMRRARTQAGRGVTPTGKREG